MRQCAIPLVPLVGILCLACADPLDRAIYGSPLGGETSGLVIRVPIPTGEVASKTAAEDIAEDIAADMALGVPAPSKEVAAPVKATEIAAAPATPPAPEVLPAITEDAPPELVVSPAVEDAPPLDAAAATAQGTREAAAAAPADAPPPVVESPPLAEAPAEDAPPLVNESSSRAEAPAEEAPLVIKRAIPSEALTEVAEARPEEQPPADKDEPKRGGILGWLFGDGDDSEDAADDGGEDVAEAAPADPPATAAKAEPKEVKPRPVRRFRAVAADEPRAALVGRDVLSGGGSAADAAVAMYFVMSVTLPSTASLGGGGVCLVHDPADGSVRALDFIARAPSQVPASATRPSAVPGSVRGMYALHARFGRAAWSDLLAPAEALARDGSPMSRALARDLVLVTDGLLADGAARLIFGKPGGVPLREGELLRQIDLATVLTRLRMAGAGDFYAGKVATALTRGAADAGGSISRADLAAYRAEWRDAISVVIDDLAVYTSPPPTAGGITAAQMWLMLGDNDRFARADDVLRPHLFAEVSMRAFADRGTWLGADGTAVKSVEQVLGPAHTRGLMANYNPSMHTNPDALAKAPAMRFENPAASSLVAMDDAGMAVACVVGTHNLFGTGRVAEGTGIVLAASPDQDGFGPAPLAPMMVLDRALGDLVMVAAASGGAAAPTALVWTAVNAIYQHMTLSQAMDAPRIHHGGAPDRVLYEPESSASWIEGLERRGHIATEVGEIGRVNAIFCPDGRAAAPAKCQAWSDRRGEGMAIGTGS